MWLKLIVLSIIVIQSTNSYPYHKRSIIENTLPTLTDEPAKFDGDFIQIKNDLYAVISPTKINNNNIKYQKRDTENNETPFNRLDLLEAFLAKNYTNSKNKIKVPIKVETPISKLPELPDKREPPPLRLTHRFKLPKRLVSSEEKMDRTNRAFDRMLRFVSLVGQVDSYISDQARLAVRKLAAMYDEEERFKRGY